MSERLAFAAASRTLGHLPGIDLDEYARDLADRFANPALAHATYRIAMDGTEKLSQRIAAPALDCLRAGGDAEAFAFAMAASGKALVHTAGFTGLIAEILEVMLSDGMRPTIAAEAARAR